MFRFLLSRRWILFAVFVVALGALCWRLGVWQFHRLHERRADNEIITRNLKAPAVPAAQVMDPGHPLAEQRQYRRVRVTGTYNASLETLVRYQTRDGQPGVTVVTPLRTQRGRTVLVDRGWMEVTNDPTAAVHPPEPPPGKVTVTGWALPDQSGDPEDIHPIKGQVRLISSRGFTGIIDRPLLQGYISALHERPPPATDLEGPEPPDLSDGPHLFYGIQWWFFAALAVGGFGYFAYAESRERRRSG